MKNILILGLGYTGTYLYNKLKTEHDVSILAKETIDYTDEDVLDLYLQAHEPDYVINCSGFTGRPNVDQCEDEKESCWRLNVTAPSMVNRLCRQHMIPYIHISSGCIFTGYDKNWTEDDLPNYGVFNNNSSFYSKSKHAYELASSDYGLTIRIRMPFDGEFTDRSVLTKLLKYDNLINETNSKTYIVDLVNFICKYIEEERDENDIVNLVNPLPLDTSSVIAILREYGRDNPKWKFVDFKELGTKAGRSNCTMDISKIVDKYGFEPMTETEALIDAMETRTMINALG